MANEDSRKMVAAPMVQVVLTIPPDGDERNGPFQPYLILHGSDGKEAVVAPIPIGGKKGLGGVDAIEFILGAFEHLAERYKIPRRAG